VLSSCKRPRPSQFHRNARSIAGQSHNFSLGAAVTDISIYNPDQTDRSLPRIVSTVKSIYASVTYIRHPDCQNRSNNFALQREFVQMYPHRAHCQRSEGEMDMEKSFVKGMAEYRGRLEENCGECSRTLHY
jgi:hypothetical protein